MKTSLIKERRRIRGREACLNALLKHHSKVCEEKGFCDCASVAKLNGIMRPLWVD